MLEVYHLRMYTIDGILSSFVHLAQDSCCNVGVAKWLQNNFSFPFSAPVSSLARILDTNLPFEPRLLVGLQGLFFL